MRSVPSYLAHLTEAGRPGDTSALRPPRPLFAPSGGPPLVAGAGGEARPPRPAPAAAASSGTPVAAAHSGGGATIPSRNEAPAAFDASRPQPARGPASPAATGFRPGGAASPPAEEPVIFPGSAGRAGPPPRRARADRQPAADDTYAAAALERPSRPTRDPDPGRKQPVRPAAVVAASTPSPGQGAASASAATGWAARPSPPGSEPGMSAREEGALASQRPIRGPSVSPAQGSSQGLSHGWPHDRASASAARPGPGPVPELIPSPSPRSARDGNSRTAAPGQPAGPALHGAAPARVTIGTIEVTVVPPAPPPPSPPTSPAPAWAPGPQRPSGDAVRRGARRWFGTGQS